MTDTDTDTSYTEDWYRGFLDGAETAESLSVRREDWLIQRNLRLQSALEQIAHRRGHGLFWWRRVARRALVQERMK